MSPRSVLGAIGAALLLTAPALAQDAAATGPLGPACWMSNLSFSVGATVRAGRASAVCRASGAWEEIDTESAAVCIYKNEAYVLGSIIAVPFAEGVLLRCNQSGSWGVNDPQ